MPWRTASCALASGAILGIASLPGPLGPLVFVGLVPLLGRITAGIGTAHAAGAGFATGLLFFGVGFGFVPISGASAGMAPAAAYAVGIPILAIGLGAFGAILAQLQRLSPLLALASAPSLWVAYEFARSEEWLFSIPWLHLAYALADRPGLIQGASVVGLYGISFWIVTVNASFVAALRSGRQVAPLLCVLAVLLLPPLAFRVPAAPLGGTPLRIAAVQPALSGAGLPEGARFDAALRSLLALTEEAVTGGADLVVWPESAYPRPLRGHGDAFLGVLANGIDTPLLTGAWRISPDSGQLRNAAFLAGRDGGLVTAAEKLHPVTVYERAPGGAVSRGLSHLGLWPGRFEPGDSSPPISVLREDGSRVSVGVLVCIDASYPDVVRRLRSLGARAYVQVSNEAATGGWSALLHARVVRFRAVETRAPFVRVANTGPSLWIDAGGRVREYIAASSTGAGSLGIAPAGPPPLAARLGDAPLVGASLGLICLGATGCGVARHRQRPTRRQSSTTQNQEKHR